MKIDSHAHILPKTWDSLKDKFGYGGFIELDHHKPGAARMMRDDGKFFREIQENCWNPEAIIKDMDEYNVDMMVLCTVPVLFNYWAKPEHTYEWSIFLNDHIADVQAKYRKRFISLGTLPMQDIPLAIKEMERCKNVLGLPGIEIGTNINGKNLDHKDFFPFYEAAEALDMGIFIHPWDMMGTDQMPDYFMPWLVGMPAEESRAICSLIFGGVFDKFPKLRFMVAHGGGSFPFTLGRVAHGYACRPDLCNVNNVKNPREYARRFWVDGITHDKDAMRYLINLMGDDRIMYGTDYPFPLGDLEHGKFLEEMADLSTQTKQNIFKNNVLDWLGLEAEEGVGVKLKTGE